VPNARYSISGGLSQEQLAALHRTALRVMDEIGVEVSDETVLRRVAGEPAVRVSGRNVRLAPDLVDRLVAEHRIQMDNRAEREADFRIEILSGYAFQNLDASSGRLRPMSTADCIETARLVDALHTEGVLGGTPGLPQDVPLPLRELLAYKIGCEHSRTSHGAGITSERAMHFAHEMALAAGKPFGLPVFTLSPLRVEGTSFSIALDFVERGASVPVAIYGMPILGLTAPLSIPGAFVEHIASTLTAFALFKLMGVESGVTFHFSVYPFDMKHGTIAYGTPEHVLSHLLGTQVNRFYGVADATCKAFHTNSPSPDAHSVAQRSAFGMAAALDGARRFTFGGMLGIDKIFSAEQLLIDVEIVRYLRHVVDGFRFDESSLGLDAIRDVGIGGTFITHESTLESYRSLWDSDLFPGTSPEQWEARGRRTLKERIGARIRQLLESHDFAPDPAVKRELDRIYAAAVRELT